MKKKLLFENGSCLGVYNTWKIEIFDLKSMAKKCSVRFLRLKSFDMKQCWRTAIRRKVYMYSVHYYMMEMMYDVVGCYVQPLFQLIITLPVEVVLYLMSYRETGLNCLSCGFFLNHLYWIFGLRFKFSSVWT